MTNLVINTASVDERKERTAFHLEAGSQLEKSVKSFDFTKKLPCYYAEDPCWKGMPMQYDRHAQRTLFGPVGTLSTSGCGVFVTYYMEYMYDYNFCLSIEEWAEEVDDKGYAEIEGIGTSVFLIDNVICALSKQVLTPAKDTRLTTVDEIIHNLEHGISVPIRVNNAIYSDDPSDTGGQYVFIIGLTDKMLDDNNELYKVNYTVAHIFDPNKGNLAVPFEKIMNAAVSDPNLTVAWDLSNIIGDC